MILAPPELLDDDELDEELLEDELDDEELDDDELDDEELLLDELDEELEDDELLLDELELDELEEPDEEDELLLELELGLLEPAPDGVLSSLPDPPQAASAVTKPAIAMNWAGVCLLRMLRMDDFLRGMEGCVCINTRKIRVNTSNC